MTHNYYITQISGALQVVTSLLNSHRLLGPDNIYFHELRLVLIRINMPLFSTVLPSIRPVENVVITTKGIQDRNNLL